MFSRPQLHAAGEGITLDENVTVRCLDLELVAYSGASCGQEQLPDTGGASGAHGMIAAVPVVEVPDNTDAPRVRRPHGECHPLDPIELPEMRAELVVDVEMGALAKQVEIEVAENRRHGVRVAGAPDVRAPPDLELVRKNHFVFAHDPFEEAGGVGLLEGKALAGGQDGDLVRAGVEGADNDAPLCTATSVHSEHGEWVVVFAGDDAQRVGMPSPHLAHKCVSRQTLSTSATDHAWAKHPRGTNGGSPSKISARLPIQPSSSCRISGCRICSTCATSS